MENHLWNSLEIAKLLINAITPILVAAIGWGLFRKIEGIKSQEARRSALHQKMADQFFSSCQDFMSAIERNLSIQSHMQLLSNNNDHTLQNVYHDEIYKELLVTNTKLIELQTKIGRNLIYAEKNEDSVNNAVESCLTHLRANPLSGKAVVNMMHDLNKAAHKAYEEILNVAAKQDTKE